MNFFELFLFSLILIIQQVFAFKEGFLNALAEKEGERIRNKLLKNNNQFRNPKHLDLNVVGWLGKIITEAANLSDNSRNTNSPLELNRPFPFRPHNRPDSPFNNINPDSPNDNRPDLPFDNNTPDLPFDNNRPNPFGENRPHPPNHRPHHPPFNRPHPSPSSLPPIHPLENGERCLTPNNEAGFCKLVEDCPIRPIITDYSNFLKYSCTIGNHGVGVCCPSNYRGTEKPKPSAKPILITSEKPITKPTSPKPSTAKPTTSKPTAPINRKSLIEEVKPDCGRSTKVKIVGGKESKAGDWPWAVPIFNAASYKDQFCGGALITKRHILTAAHCMTHRKPKDIFIRVGAYDIQSEDENQGAYNVIKIVLHPQYSNVSNANDVAIITLDKDVQFTASVNPVCVPNDEDDYVKEDATVVGWGTTSYSGSSSSKLQEVKVPVWSLKDCQNVYGAKKITDKQICAGLKEGGKDSCQGDSGGPLLKISRTRGRFEVIGIVSYGFRCAEANNPGVYTKVNRYYKWINEQTVM